MRLLNEDELQAIAAGLGGSAMNGIVSGIAVGLFVGGPVGVFVAYLCRFLPDGRNSNRTF